jgi:hypothetical protein
MLQRELDVEAHWLRGCGVVMQHRSLRRKDMGRRERRQKKHTACDDILF